MRKCVWLFYQILGRRKGFSEHNSKKKTRKGECPWVLLHKNSKQSLEKLQGNKGNLDKHKNNGRNWEGNGWFHYIILQVSVNQICVKQNEKAKGTVGKTL